MPAELVLRLTGGTQNTDPAKSLGGETSAWPVDLGDVFPDVAAPEALRGEVLYRALDLLNVGNQGAHHCEAWLEPGDSVDLGLSEISDVSLLVTPGHQGTPYDHGAPVAFAPHPAGSPREIPDIAPGRARRLWLRRTIPHRSPGGIDTETLRLSYR